MTVPTKSYTVVVDTRIDVDSPLDETLLEDLRDNIEHIHEWLGYGYTAAQAHDHDGVNSALLQGNITANIFNYQNFR